MDRSLSSDGVKAAVLGQFIVLETLRKAAWIKQGEWALERDQYAQGDDTEKGTARVVQDAIGHLRSLRLEWDWQNRKLGDLIPAMFPPNIAEGWKLWSPFEGDDLFDPDKAVRMAAYTEEALQETA